jgi:hypothetical protein
MSLLCTAALLQQPLVLLAQQNRHALEILHAGDVPWLDAVGLQPLPVVRRALPADRDRLSHELVALLRRRVRRGRGSSVFGVGCAHLL